MASERERLLRLLGRYSYRTGDFVLSSGRRSNFLIDVKRTALHPEGNQLIGRAMLRAIRERWPGAVGIGGRTLGADPLAVAVARASLEDGGAPLHAFIVRKEPKGHGTGHMLEMSGGLAVGAPVVVLEDVSTTGGSSLAAVKAARAEGLDVLGALTLIDREEGAAERFAQAEVPFERVFVGSDVEPHAH